MSKNKARAKTLGAAILDTPPPYPEPDMATIDRVGAHYAYGVTPQILSTIKDDPSRDLMHDPVALQYFPQMRELETTKEERADPIGDEAHTPVKGLVHRYPDRVLLKPANICAVYCRYCFRREKVGPGSDVLSQNELNHALDYIRNNPKIREVILTGGDPLILSPRRLGALLKSLAEIPHIEIIRIHSRIPVADPARITPELCAALDQDKPIYLAIHINHAQEITPEIEGVFKALHHAGCVLLSQSVLLKGVNDKAEILETLFRKLLTLRVKPYYIHHPDFARGTAHFRLTLEEGQAIMRDLFGRLSGLCQPHYMLDIPGGFGKVPINASYIKKLGENRYRITDNQGRTHIYP